MDILVELEDGGLANVEMQKIGYNFPGERAASYSSDLLLRQYSQVKGEKKKDFSYRDIKNVYTIVLIEKSPSDFKNFPQDYRHHFKQTSDTGLKLNLLQEYIYIPLDVYLDNYRKNPQNISNELDAWLLLLISSDPAAISYLVDVHPWLKEIYADIFAFRQNPERLVDVYSKALEIMDRNTVRFMIEEQKQEIEEQKQELEDQKKVLKAKDKVLEAKDKIIEEKDKVFRRKR